MIPRISPELIESAAHDFKKDKKAFYRAVELAARNDPLIGLVISTLSTGIDDPSKCAVSMYILYAMLLRADECANIAKENGVES